MSTRPHREIARTVREGGAPYLDSYAALKPFVVGADQPTYYYRDNMHFNPRGNALWADAHVRFLLDPAHQLLPKAFYAAQGKGD